MVSVPRRAGRPPAAVAATAATVPGYDWVALTLHWLIAAAVIGQIALGLWMIEIPKAPAGVRAYWFNLHKSIGLTILALASLRLLWRLYAGTPPTIIPRWQHRLASVSHVGLYVLLFAVPISGWIMNSAAGFPLWWFGLFRVPAIASRDHGLHELAESTHEFLFWTLILLVLVHASAALYHHLFQHDATLARMLPRGWLAAPSEESRDA